MVYCAVYGCKSSNKGPEKVVFHRFPNNTAEAAKWLQFCRRADIVNLKNAAVCGLHFKETDYRRNLRHELLNPGRPECRPKLRHGAVPSVQLPQCNLGAETDARIRKKYLYDSACEGHTQKEDKRCKECGAPYQCTATSASPMLSGDIKFGNRDFSKTLSTVKLEGFNSHREKDGGICDDLIEEPESLTHIVNYEYPTVCLVCDTMIKDSATVGIADLFSESSLTSHTRQQIVIMLAVLIDTPLNSDKAFSKALCQRCFRLLDELDEVQNRSTIIKANIERIYNQSLQKRNMMPTGSAVDTELPAKKHTTSVHDHQYIKQAEQINKKNVLPLTNHSSLKTRERSSGPFDRGQWRKDEAIKDARRRGEDPVYREIVRKGWRERKAKQRMKEIGFTEKQMALKNEEQYLTDVEEVLSSFINNQSEPEVPSVLLETHASETNGQIVCAEKIHVSNAKPITIKVLKTDTQLMPVANGISKPKVKRQYRKRSHIVHLCKFCMNVFATGDELKKHQKTHTTIECKYCGKILVRIGAWENHLRTFHNVEIQSSNNFTEETLACDTCGKQFTSKSALRYHVKLHDDKVYTCSKCGKEFNHPGTLKNHQLIHEDRKYICDKCGKGFRTNFHLIMHDNQTHRKARSWKCKYCEKAFARCATFREHMRSHNTDKLGHRSPSQQHMDVSCSGTDVKNVVPSLIVKPQPLNEDVHFNEECAILGIEEEVVNEEASIIIDENETTCEEQNLVINSDSGLYVEEFVLNDDGNIMIRSLMKMK